MILERTDDKIVLQDLRFRCVIGVNPNERNRRQRIAVAIELHTDLSRAGASDCLEETVSYSDLAHRIVDHARGSSYMLIEALAEAIAEICLESERIKGVKVLVKKPRGLKRAAFAGVEIFRSRTAVQQRETDSNE